MKRNIIISIFISILLLITFSVKAQIIQSGTAQLSIKISDVMSIDPSSSIHSESVLFQYKNEGDYNTNQTIVKESYLIITATQTFDVKVKADGPNFIGEGNAAGSLIPVNVLTLDATGNTNLSGATISVINLSTENQNIITAANRGSDKHVTVKYIIPQAKSQSTDILGKPGGNYMQTLTYSVTAH